MKKNYDYQLNMGPQHPSTHGVLRLLLDLDGEVVKNIEPEIGYLHRCKEKHSENIDWWGVTPFVDRLDYLASMNNSLGYAMAVEELGNIEVPYRAQWIRTIVAELQRIASHLMAFGTYAIDLGAVTPFMYALREREQILDIFEHLSGARLLYNYMWIGGVMSDLTPNIRQMIQAFVPIMKEKLKLYQELLSENTILKQRTMGVGLISTQVCFDYGITGPILRASGYSWDLRKDEPYLLYPEVEFDIASSKKHESAVEGDCWNRYQIRLEEIYQSLKIIEQLIDKNPSGPLRGKVGKRIKIKPGHIYHRTECPRGELGFFIISDGGFKPYRIKVKSPCLLALSCLEEVGKNMLFSDLVATIGSLDIVLGEIDR